MTLKTFRTLGLGLIAYCLAIALTVVWAASSHARALMPAAGPLFETLPVLPEIALAGLIINQGTIRDLFISFKANYQQGFQSFQEQSFWMKIATLVPSSTRENVYAWLGQFPELREWIGDRHVKGMASHDYRIVNRKFESTIEVKRDDIEDDQYGVYGPLFSAMGLAAAQHPDRLIAELLSNAFSELGYDGQAFFDTDHPVGNGVASNTGGGGGSAWFLFDVSKPLKPLIFQKRREYDLKAMTERDDEVVFTRDGYRYGVDARVNVGLGFWQQAYGSKQTLNAAAYAAARAAMMSFKSDEGRPLGIMPNLLVVPPTLEAAGREILLAERDAMGATNVWRNSAELLVVPWLA